MDKLSRERRSANMSRIRGVDTQPEVAVRRLAHKLGFRFRLHRRDLPGTPDIVFAKRSKVIFVHGCFWHRHSACRLAYSPKSNVEFWNQKFSKNVARDARATGELKGMGWDVLTVWQCEISDIDTLAKTLVAYLRDTDA